MLITFDIDGVLADTPSYTPWKNGGRERWLKDLPNLKPRWPKAIYDITHPKSLGSIPPNFALVSSRPPETLEATRNWIMDHSKDLSTNKGFVMPHIVCTGSLAQKSYVLLKAWPIIHFDDDPRMLDTKHHPRIEHVIHYSWNSYYKEKKQKPLFGLNTWEEIKLMILPYLDPNES